MIGALTFLCAAAAGPVVLDNGAIRIEVDPVVFSVRFVGTPGGHNFLDTLYVDPQVRGGGEWLDPGGLVTDVVPQEGSDAALRRGPSEVIEYTSTTVALLGPVSETAHVRLKKLIRIHPTKARAWYTVTALRVVSEAKPLALRNTARVPVGSMLRIPVAEGVLRPLAGTTTTDVLVNEVDGSWQIPVPPTVPAQGVLLGAHTSILCHDNGYGIWTRRLNEATHDDTDGPPQDTFLCLLDTQTGSYGAALQSGSAEVTPATPAVFTEEWRIETRASKAGKAMLDKGLQPLVLRAEETAVQRRAMP